MFRTITSLVSKVYVRYHQEIADRSRIGYAPTTIGRLPDDALLEMFSFYLIKDPIENEKWYTLVHVCRRWRRIIFASPLRLDLRIDCTAGTRVNEMLHIWPFLPIQIRDNRRTRYGEGADHIIVALEQNDRVCEIILDGLPVSLLERIAAVMQEPFPALTDLRLYAATPQTVPVFPETFLGGFAPPRLQSLFLDGFAFPGVWKLLLSAHHLVVLSLWNIPHSGYISPEAMVTALSATPNLQSFEIAFQSSLSRPDQASRQPPPLTRIILPALTTLSFIGVSEYVEDLVCQIDVPLLNNLNIWLFNQLIFDTPLLHDFFARTEMFKAHVRADVRFDGVAVHFNLEPRFYLGISCTELDWQLSLMSQVCGSSLPLFSTLERLYIITEGDFRPHWLDDVENTQWLELLRPFASLKDLYLDENTVLLIAPALQELSGERVTEVFPALQNLFREGPQESELMQEVIEQFIDARQLSGHPVNLLSWERSQE